MDSIFVVILGKLILKRHIKVYHLFVCLTSIIGYLFIDIFTYNKENKYLFNIDFK